MALEISRPGPDPQEPHTRLFNPSPQPAACPGAPGLSWCTRRVPSFLGKPSWLVLSLGLPFWKVWGSVPPTPASLGNHMKHGMGVKAVDLWSFPGAGSGDPRPGLSLRGAAPGGAGAPACSLAPPPGKKHTPAVLLVAAGHRSSQAIKLGDCVYGLYFSYQYLPFMAPLSAVARALCLVPRIPG